MTESSLSNLSPAATQAVQALSGSFGNVISSLQGLIASPSDSRGVLGFLEIINGTRCDIVLLNLDILWLAAADASGKTPVNFNAEVPAVCSQTT